VVHYPLLLSLRHRFSLSSENPDVNTLRQFHKILLILDEVMVGFGRTGRWFAFEHYGVEPDILCLAKGINSGYVPLGAMVVEEAIGEWLDTHAFPGGLTYSGHPLACASGAAAIQIMLEEGIVDNAAKQGDLLLAGLRELQSRHPSIGEVRGVGLFGGVELVRNRRTREPLVPFNAKGEAAVPMKRVLRAAMDRGLYISANDNVIRIAPPLILCDEDREFGLAALDKALLVADEWVDE
jgi:taurine--2-oxoglutarate transaminase